VPRRGKPLLMEKSAVMRSFFEATMGFEPMMRVLQTLALPLGDVARGITFCLAIYSQRAKYFTPFF
jgi:hypothetical protein